MSKDSKIQWTDHTWNIAVGCSKVDADCKYCYMFRGSLNDTRYDPKVVRKTKTVFKLPLKIKEPSKIFTSSLTDVFHPDCDDFRNEMWDIIRKCPQHTFQILTKRPERIANNLPEDWNENFSNVWLGTSVGSEDGTKRIYEIMDAFNVFKNGGKELRKPITFISFEPLHQYIDCNFDLSTIIWFDWIIIGGESGNENGKYRYRECKIEWIDEIINSFKNCGVAIFVKQLGTHLAKELKLKDRHGGDITEWPEHLQIREFPKQN